MKAFFTVLFILGLMPTLPFCSQALGDEGAPVARFSREEITELVGPIALYPDPLVALILPASTFPSDVVLASRFLDSGADLALADEKPWDSSVVGLVRYPATLKWMDDNLEWTTQLGDAYLTQPEDVMDAIQQLRAQAASVGNLVDTPQQRILEDDSYIRIIPADPEYIYVPYYDPEVVYYERPVSVPLLTFSVGCEVGPWLRYDCDWHHRRLYCGDWHQGWDYRRDHDRNDHRGDDVCINRQLTNSRVWHGDAGRRIASAHFVAQARVSHGQNRSVALPEHFADRSHHRDSVPRALTVDGNISRSPTSTAGPSRDMNRGDHNSRDRFVMPHTSAPSVAGNGKLDDDKFRGDPRSRSHGDESNGNIPHALPFHVDGNDHVSGGRAPNVPSVAGSGKHDDNNNRFRSDPRTHSQGEVMGQRSTVNRETPERGDAARMADAAARARTEMNHPHEYPTGSSRRDVTPHVVTNPQQVSPIHHDVQRSQGTPSVQRSNPVITGHVERNTPQARVVPQEPQHVSPQIREHQAAARIEHSAPQVHVAPQVQRSVPQAPMAAHVQHSAPQQARVAPQVQHSAPPQNHIAPQMHHSSPAAQAPQVRSDSSRGGSSSSNDDSHKRRH